VTDAQGLRYDAVAELYERGRTDWPAAVADGVAGDVVLDLAAGTGKLARVLAPRFREVVCVEPLDGMRAVGERVVPAARWLAGTAEAIPLDDASVDAAFVADAFHWFDAPRAVAELARVLRPGGTLTLLFTAWDGSFEPGPPPAALDAVRTVSRRTGRTGLPRVESGAWRGGFAGAPFGDLVDDEVPFTHRTDRDGVIAYYLSMSTIAARPQAERDDLATTLRGLLPDVPHRLRVRARRHRTRRR
jgi:SAM-dependent methyltransferase